MNPSGYDACVALNGHSDREDKFSGTHVAYGAPKTPQTQALQYGCLTMSASVWYPENAGIAAPQST